MCYWLSPAVDRQCFSLPRFSRSFNQAASSRPSSSLAATRALTPPRASAVAAGCSMASLSRRRSDARRRAAGACPAAAAAALLRRRRPARTPAARAQQTGRPSLAAGTAKAELLPQRCASSNPGAASPTTARVAAQLSGFRRAGDTRCHASRTSTAPDLEQHVRPAASSASRARRRPEVVHLGRRRTCAGRRSHQQASGKKASGKACSSHFLAAWSARQNRPHRVRGPLRRARRRGSAATLRASAARD
jgi:hypothetical protein